MTYKIAMSGASGFVGSYLRKAFDEEGLDIVPLGRDDFSTGPEGLAKKMENADVVVNLAGAPVIRRWTKEYKKTIYDSRIDVTKMLVEAFSVMKPKPKLLISTSAVGYYGSEGINTEDKYMKADDFLGHLARDWEEEALRAGAIGIRTVIFRFGVVLGRDGGALKQMMTTFKFGLGGTIGDGSQGFSWIHIKDLYRAYIYAIENSACKGIYNLTAPNPSTNSGLTAALSKALKKTSYLVIPTSVLKLKYGEGADALINGQSVIPKRLLESGFKFLFTEIDEAVRDCIS
jgi:uncharacterized protein (TIGR01777 family)